MRLTSTGAQLYLATSNFALVCGVLSWDEYLLRLRFVRDCAEPNTLETRLATDILREESAETEENDEWPAGEPEQSVRDNASNGSKLSLSDSDMPFEPPILHLVVSANTGLQNWEFHQADRDFFPSIPHGHWHSDQRKKLHAYRGWIYQRDKQVDREPRWKIIALWNDDKFRSFASTAIQYYLITFPNYRWPVPYPHKLPRRRRR